MAELRTLCCSGRNAVLQDQDTKRRRRNEPSDRLSKHHHLVEVVGCDDRANEVLPFHSVSLHRLVHLVTQRRPARDR